MTCPFSDNDITRASGRQMLASSNMDDSETESEHYSDYDDYATAAPPSTHEACATDEGLSIHALCSGEKPQAAFGAPKGDRGHNRQSSSATPFERFVSPFASLAERQLSADVKHEPATQSEMLCTVCVRCHLPLNRIVRTTDASLPYYCVCCRRPLPVESFSAAEAKRRVIRRCLNCVKAGDSRDPETLRSFAALVPESVRRAPLAESALRLMTEAARQLRAKGLQVRLEEDARLKMLSVQVKKLAQDHQANRAKQIDIMQRGGAAQMRLEQVYDEWIALEGTRWSLRRQQLDVYCELLMRHGSHLPAQSKKRLLAAGVSPVALDAIEEQDAVSSPVAETPVKTEEDRPSMRHSCSRCQASVSCVSSVEEAASALWCMCCQLPLSRTSFSPGQLTKNVLRRCAACVAAGGASDTALGLHLVQEIPVVVRRAATIDKALREITQLMAKQGLDEKSSDGSTESVAEREAYLIADRARNVTQLKEVIRQGGAPQKRFGAVYSELIRIEETQCDLRLERVTVMSRILIERGGHLPEDFRDVLTSVCVDDGLLREITWVPNQCEVCSAALISTQVPNAHPAFCDCCKRVIADTLVAYSQETPNFSLCQVCADARSMSNVALQQNSPRVGRSWIGRLVSASKELEKFLRSSRFDFKGPHGQHQTALQTEVNTLRKKFLKLIDREKEAVNLKFTVRHYRGLYSEHVKIETELHPLVVKLVKYRLDTLSRRGGRLRQTLKDMARKLYGDDGVPPKVQEMLDRPSLPDGEKVKKSTKRQRDESDQAVSHEHCQKNWQAVLQPTPDDEVIKAFEKQTDEYGQLLGKLMGATQKLKLTLEAAGVGTTDASDPRLAALELDVERWRSKRSRVKNRRQNARDASVGTLRSMAEARALVNKGLAEAANEMVRHLLARCNDHGLKLPSSVESVVGLLRQPSEQQ